MTAHILDLVCLWILFYAYGQKVLLGTLVAGYAIGVLFWIVSITPQGIGVVEGLMAIVYTSLHIKSEIAVVVSLAFRGLAFWLPLLIGFFMLQRVKTFSTTERRKAGTWNVRLIAILTGLMGVLNILSATTPAIAGRLTLLEQILPLEVRHGSHLASVLAGFSLLLLAGQLWRKKRVAWFLTLVVLAITIISHLFKGLDYEEALLASVLGIWLVVARDQFHARSDRPSIIQGIQVLAGAVIFVLVYGMFGFYFLERHFVHPYTLWDGVKNTILLFSQLDISNLEPVTKFGRYFASSVFAVAGVTLVYSGLLIIRPVLVRQPSTLEERAKTATIVEKYGHTSLARFLLFDDKLYYYSTGGSVIGYVLKHAIALTLGDPVGPPEDLEPTIQAFKEYCARNDWQVSFYQTQADTLEVYKRQSFQALCIGQEAIVNLGTFTTEGGENKSMRSAVNRLSKAGFRAEIFSPPINDQLLGTLRDISDEWLVEMHGSEKRFSLGWFDDDYVRNCSIMVVISTEGVITAFTNIVSEYQLNEATIDMMRHRRDVLPGTMDFLFVSLMEWAKRQGYDTFNLGLSALSGIGENSDSPAIEKALHYIYEHINQFYNFKGLHAFKQKYHPVWSPRYLIHHSRASLPAIALTMVQADSGDDVIIQTVKSVFRKKE